VLADDDQWGIQGGIKRNFTGLGFTSFYGEYLHSEGFGELGSGFAATTTIASSEASFWGLGVVQKIDAAAMDLYLSYRHHEVDVSQCTTAGNTAATCRATAAKVDLKDFDTLVMGARIQF
jgi:hypothetical protein